VQHVTHHRQGIFEQPQLACPQPLRSWHLWMCPLHQTPSSAGPLAQPEHQWQLACTTRQHGHMTCCPGTHCRPPCVWLVCPAAMVLGGGPGTDLWPLTHTRAEVSSSWEVVWLGSYAGADWCSWGEAHVQPNPSGTVSRSLAPVGVIACSLPAAAAKGVRAGM
jgi:hypothetical protein